MGNYLAKSVACYYSKAGTCILVGYVNYDRQLVIEKEIKLDSPSIEEVAIALQELEIKPWINKHEPLKHALHERCEEVDFNGEHKSDLEPLVDLLEDLRLEKRMIVPEHISIKGTTRTQALQLLVKSLVKPLCDRPSEIKFQSTNRRSSYQLSGFIPDYSGGSMFSGF